MRRLLPFLLALPLAFAALASLPAATAAATTTADDGCTQADPCEWAVIVNADGFLESDWNWTAGDWLKLAVSNDDDVAHTVSLVPASGGAPVASVTSQGVAEAASAPFQLAVGDYTLKDSPSGDTAHALALKGDSVAYENGIAGASTSGKGRIPGFELPLALAGLAAVASLSRRR
jgi:hypothetical protein